MVSIVSVEVSAIMSDGSVVDQVTTSSTVVPVTSIPVEASDDGAMVEVTASVDVSIIISSVEEMVSVEVIVPSTLVEVSVITPDGTVVVISSDGNDVVVTLDSVPVSITSSVVVLSVASVVVIMVLVDVSTDSFSVSSSTTSSGVVGPIVVSVCTVDNMVGVPVKVSSVGSIRDSEGRVVVIRSSPEVTIEEVSDVMTTVVVSISVLPSVVISTAPVLVSEMSGINVVTWESICGTAVCFDVMSVVNNDEVDGVSVVWTGIVVSKLRGDA